MLEKVFEKVSVISSYNQESVPLLISNAFPSIKTDEKQIDYLPKPLIKPLDETTKDNMFKTFFSSKKNEETKEKRIFNDILKKLKKQSYVSFDIFEKKLKFAFSYKNLYELILKNEACPINFSPKPEKNCVNSFRDCPFLITKENKYDNECEYLEKLKIQKDEIVYRNVKDRITERVNAGGLFSSNYTFYNQNAGLNIYIKTTLEDDFLYEIFDYIQNTGFGADKSVGKGQFNYKIYEVKLPECKTSNGFISLSNFFLTPLTSPLIKGGRVEDALIKGGRVEDALIKGGRVEDALIKPIRNSSSVSPSPARGEGWGEVGDGFYEIEPKFPKMGETYANSGNPFKKPLLMIHPGAFFYTDKVYDFYGQLIKGVYDKPEIVQYSYIFPMGVNVQ